MIAFQIVMTNKHNSNQQSIPEPERKQNSSSRVNRHLGMINNCNIITRLTKLQTGLHKFYCQNIDKKHG